MFLHSNARKRQDTEHRNKYFPEKGDGKIIDQLKERLLRRETDLERVAVHLRNSILKAPDGYLHISSCRGCPQYHQIEDNGGTRTRYLKKKNMDLIKALAQKSYDRKLLNAVEKEQRMVREMLRIYAPQDLRNVFLKLSERRRALVDPRIPSNEEKAAAWLSSQYEKKPLAEDDAEIYSEKGDRVRSKSEKMIADKLLLMGIPYKYECPLYLNGFGKVHPDFTLYDAEHDTEIYLEHMGMLDNPQYAVKAVQKIEAYEKNGFFPGDRLLLTFETSGRPMNMRLFEKMIRDRFAAGSGNFMMFRES